MRQRKATGQAVVQKRGARWAKVLSKLSPQQLEQMKQSAQSSGARRQQPRQYLKSTGQVGDQWLPKSFGSPLSAEFYTEAWTWVRHQFTQFFATPWRMRTVAREKDITRITRAQVRETAIQLFERYNRALANLEIDKMDQFVTETWHYELRQKYANRRANPTLDYIWECKDVKAEIVTYNSLQIPPPVDGEFLQAAVRITSYQKLKVCKKGTGELVAGKDEWAGPVVDNYVIEKSLNADASSTQWVIITPNFKPKPIKQ